MSYSGMDSSGSRINVTPKTSEPKASKLVSNSAHGANMAIPAGGQKMRLETYPRGSTKTADMNPKGPKPKGC